MTVSDEYRRNYAAIDWSNGLKAVLKDIQEQEETSMRIFNRRMWDLFTESSQHGHAFRSNYSKIDWNKDVGEAQP